MPYLLLRVSAALKAKRTWSQKAVRVKRDADFLYEGCLFTHYTNFAGGGGGCWGG